MKVVIVDDHPLVRSGISSVLSSETGFEITGEAGCVSEALQAIASTNPDLTLVDLKLGKENGLQIVKKAREKGYSSKYAILTSSADGSDFHDAEELDVDGYILKEALPEEIIYALRLIYKGRKYYDPILMKYLLADNEKDGFSLLTEREKDVLSIIAKGMSNNEIAKTLFISNFTVKKHVSQILAKLGLQGRTQAAIYANSHRFR